MEMNKMSNCVMTKEANVPKETWKNKVKIKLKDESTKKLKVNQQKRKWKIINVS